MGPSFESEYRRTAAALEATCRREEAERAVLVATKQALELYFVWATSGPDRDQEYIDGVLSAQLGQIDETLGDGGVIAGSEQKVKRAIKSIKASGGD
jgi:hypothetical protein